MIGTYAISNCAGIRVMEINHDTEKVTVDWVVGDKVKTHRVKFNHIGFRIGRYTFRWDQIMRA